MNKTLKIILYFINGGMLILAIFWFKRDLGYEPVIVTFGQIAVLVGLIFEKKFSSVFTKDINNSKVKIKRQSGDSIHTEDVNDSEINIS